MSPRNVHHKPHELTPSRIAKVLAEAMQKKGDTKRSLEYWTKHHELRILGR